MVWCSSCARSDPNPTFLDGTICCTFCGRVLDEDNFSTEVTFVKDGSGQYGIHLAIIQRTPRFREVVPPAYGMHPPLGKILSRAAGSNVRSIQSEYSASRSTILLGARDGMDMMLCSLHEQNRDAIVNTALKFYTIALERNFTKGRRRELVEAACLYLACRETKKPYLLSDFAEYLQINVYVIGAVFLELCKLLSLQEHPIVQKPIDPSLFIHRFANGLVGNEHYKEVARDALHIIFKMKRDWMQTGRKPSGICGAALYVSAISHCGRKYTKSDIQRIVHVCEATLTRRLIEFEETDSGSLTIEEFVKNADSLERECRTIKEAPESGMKENILLCEHKGSGIPVFAHGLCRDCYSEFIELSGGFDGGSDPPAFQRAERQRKAKESADEELHADELAYDTLNVEKEPDTTVGSQTNKLKLGDADANSDSIKHVENDYGFDKSQEEDGSKSKDSDNDDPENFADIDDIEVDGYIHNEREQQLKKIIWEQLNKEYLEEQAAKEAAAAAEQAAYEASLSNHPDDVRARELAAAANARVAQTRKEKQQKRAAELKNAAPPKTAAEATKQMLSRKRLSSKINFEVLDKLFEDDPVDNPKKIQKRDDAHTHKLGSIKEVDEEGEEDSKYENERQDAYAYDEVAADYYYDEED